MTLLRLWLLPEEGCCRGVHKKTPLLNFDLRSSCRSLSVLLFIFSVDLRAAAIRGQKLARRVRIEPGLGVIPCASPFNSPLDRG